MSNTSAIVYKLMADASQMKAQLVNAERNLERYKQRTTAIGSQIQSAIAGYFSVFAVAAFGKAQFELIKQIDSTNKALKAVTGTSEEYNRVKLMLSDSAEKFGLNIMDMTKAYTKFTAATKSSKLSTQELDGVFMRIAKSTSILGLSAEQTEGAFRAIEQIFSKGNVQAEEIRGQLSERLPGAFNILASSMGVSTAELNKLLKEGKVLADEVMPAFAAAYEKAVGADQLQRVETLVAAQNRLGNSWKQFVESVENGEGVISQGLSGIFSIFSDFLNVLSGLNNGTISLGEALAGLGTSYGRASLAQEILKRNTEKLKNAQELAAKQTKALGFAFDTALLRGLDTFDKFLESGNRLGDYYQGLPDDVANAGFAQDKLNQIMKMYADRADEAAKKQGALKAKVDAYNKSVEGAVKLSAEYGEQLKNISDISKDAMSQATDIFAIKGGSADMDFDWLLPPDEIAASTDALPAYVEKMRGAFDESKGIMTGYVEHMRMMAATIQGIMAQMATDVIESMVTNLVMGKSPFASILGILGDGLIQLGKFLIIHSKVMAGIKAALANPFSGAGFGVGIAAIAAGAALKKAAMAANNDMASGGGGGGRGTPRGGFSSNEFGGQSVAINGQFIIKGKDLVYILDENRTQDSRAKSGR